MSVATVMVTAVFAAVVILAIGYRTGRAHAAWRDFHSARRDVGVKRRRAWSQTRALALGALILCCTLFAAAWNASH